MSLINDLPTIDTVPTNKEKELMSTLFASNGPSIIIPSPIKSIILTGVMMFLLLNTSIDDAVTSKEFAVAIKGCIFFIVSWLGDLVHSP